MDQRARAIVAAMKDDRDPDWLNLIEEGLKVSPYGLSYHLARIAAGFPPLK